MRVLFWGTPDFATPTLRALLGEGVDVVGVVTQPDRPRGRHHSTVVPPPVKEVALEDDILVLQPERPRGEEFLGRLRALAPDLAIVVAYGHILPQEVIDLPPAGTLNVHASLLPRWRGAAPVEAAILAGDQETGITIMRMVPRLDAGPIVLRHTTRILDDETGGELRLRLSELGALAMVEALSGLESGMIGGEPQDETGVTWARKVDRSMTMIDWSEDAVQIQRMIRAFDPHPGARTILRGVEVKLFGARVAADASGDPGYVLDIDESGMLVACGRIGLRIGYAQPAGKRRLAALDWSQGRGIATGDVLGH